MHRTSSFRFLLVLSMVAFIGSVALTGCDTLTKLFITNQQEVEIGRGVAQNVHDQYKLLKTSDPVAQWADALVQNMVPASAQFRDPADIGGYKVNVIYDNSLVNAFATPGGFVYIGSGLVLQTDSCGEVAGVVGHEIAHVTERHSAKKIAESSAFLGLSGAVLKEGLTKNVIDGVYAFLQNTTFSRKDESAADKVGTVILHDSGYNPYALAHLFQTLAELNKGNEPIQFLSSHPLSKNRASSIREEIDKKWPSLQENDDPTYIYDCIGTSTSYSDIKTRLQSDDLQVDPSSGLHPPEDNSNGANLTPQDPDAGDDTP